MITIIDGAKGTGKTKKILTAANGSLDKTKGEVLFLTTTNRYRMEVNSKIRYIDASEQGITTKDALIGFVKGLLCGNYDIESVYIDGFYKMACIACDSADSAEFFLVLDKLATNVNFILTVSSERENLPAFIAKYTA